MKLLMITGDRALAANQKGAFYNTLAELHKHFERIDIICPKSKTTSYEMSVFNNVFIHASPWGLLWQWLWIYRKGTEILKAQNFKPENHNYLVTVHEYAPFYNGLGARLLRRKTSAPFVFEIMHIPGLPRAAGLRELIYRWLTRLFIASDVSFAKAVRVINQHEVPKFLIKAGVPQEKIVYAPAFYIDLEAFKPQESDKQYDVIFVGRLARNKGIDLFLDVVRRGNLVAVVVGDGPLLKKAKEKAKRLKLKINFAGFARDAAEVSAMINRSRLLLMTSWNEGGPRVVLESLACGVPVVATPVGIVPDVLPPECIEEWSATDLAAKVQNLLNDEALYARVREAGLFTAKKFERAEAITNYAQKLHELAK